MRFNLAGKFLLVRVVVGTGAAALLLSGSGKEARAQVGYVAKAPPTTPRAQDNGESHAGIKDFAAYIPDPVKYPIPRTAWDNKPDFTGVYYGSIYVADSKSPANPKLLKPVLDQMLTLLSAQGKEYRQRVDPEESTGIRCEPDSPARGGMHPALAKQFTQAPGRLLIINSYSGSFRVIPTDGSPAEKSSKPTFQGDSSGHWEGDTLVVDVSNFTARKAMGLWYRDVWSDALHVTERWSQPDGQTIEYQAVIQDPKLLTGSWTTPRVRLARASKSQEPFVEESFCIQDERLALINGEQKKAAKEGIRSAPLQRLEVPSSPPKDKPN